jgi:hypothetical protein
MDDSLLGDGNQFQEDFQVRQLIPLLISSGVFLCHSNQQLEPVQIKKTLLIPALTLYISSKDKKKGQIKKQQTFVYCWLKMMFPVASS